MTPDELAGIQVAFTKSLEPIATELRGIHRVLDEHSRLLHEHSQLLRNIDGRLVRVEGRLDGVEILVRTKTGS